MSTQRYVPITQGFNDDPEAWELTYTFGDRSIRLWIEILRIMEESANQWRMVDGWSTSLSRKVRQSPANVQRIVDWMLAKGWLIVGQESTNGSPIILTARNYAKFHDRHKTAKKTTADNDVVPLPILPSEPSFLKPSPTPPKTQPSKTALKADRVLKSDGTTRPRELTHHEKVLQWKKELAQEQRDRKEISPEQWTELEESLPNRPSPEEPSLNDDIPF